MKIFAIDTTSHHGSIAISDGERVVEEVALPTGDGFDHILFAEIESLLKRHRLALTDIDAFASASGPGTFTGVRVGLTVVKGLAEATARKVIAVSNLKAMAWFGSRELRAPWIDARRGDIYGALYDSSLNLVRDEVVMKHDAWLASLPVGAEILSDPRLLAGAIATIASTATMIDPAAVDANYVRRSDAEQMWKDAP